MLGLTFKNIKEINELGYRIIEDEDGIKTNIIDGEEKNVAIISVNDQGHLSMVVGSEKIEKIKWIEVEASYCPKTLVLEIKTIESGKWWCQLPTKDDLPVFWNV